MELDVINYQDLHLYKEVLVNALLNKGIVALRGIPFYEKRASTYIDAARKFSALPTSIKKQYSPKRDMGQTEGYELGAEKFKDDDGTWQIDDKKASFYACIPNSPINIWPKEVNLKDPYCDLSEVMYAAGQKILALLGLDESRGFKGVTGYGRMLHYLKETATHKKNPNWCGAHYDHGMLTALMPAYYFKDGRAVDEPEEAGLYIVPTGEANYQKINASDKSICLFQVGEFGQLASNDTIRATKHLVKKAKADIERFTLALFIDPGKETVIKSSSSLTRDTRYNDNLRADGYVKYHDWEQSSYARYLVK